MINNDISLDDVAQAAGVSPATASRVLNGRPGVSDNLRTRVLAVASSLGYRPNRAARNLAGGRTSVIGLILDIDVLPEETYAAALLQAIAEAANAVDVGLMLVLDSANPSEAVKNLLGDGLVEGVIVSAIAIGERWVEDLLDAQMPTVLVGSHPRRSDVPVVDVDQRPAAATLVGHLLDSGCKRIATITGIPSRVDTDRRLEGYRDAHEERGLVPDPELVFEGNFLYDGGHRAATAIFDTMGDSGVDGVFAANDLMAYAVLDQARERGINVPRQLGVAGFDGVSRLQDFGIELTTVEQPFAEMAEAAITTLTGLINNRDVPLEQLVKARLKLGDSTRSESVSGNSVSNSPIKIGHTDQKKDGS